jgi:hypothetical protein
MFARQPSGDICEWRKAYKFLSDPEQTTDDLQTYCIHGVAMRWTLLSNMPPAESEYLLVCLHTLLLDLSMVRRATKCKPFQPILFLLSKDLSMLQADCRHL